MKGIILIFLNKNVKDSKQVKEKLWFFWLIAVAIISCISSITLIYTMMKIIELYLISPGKSVSLCDIYLGLTILGANIVLMIGDLLLALHSKFWSKLMGKEKQAAYISQAMSDEFERVLGRRKLSEFLKGVK